MIVCAGKSENFAFAKSIGIGLVESAINLSLMCQKDLPNGLVFIGSAGSYGNAQIFDIIESVSASNVEIGFFSHKSYTPLENLVQIENVSRETLSNAIINSSNYITSDEFEANTFLKAGFELENMEFFSVLNVARKFKIPCFGVFVVTNFCNQNAHQDFIKNHEKAKQILTNYIYEKVLK